MKSGDGALYDSYEETETVKRGWKNAGADIPASVSVAKKRGRFGPAEVDPRALSRDSIPS